MREGKEKTPKADREKIKSEEKSSKEDKTKAGNVDPVDPSRDAVKESKSKEKGDRTAATVSLKSPNPRSEPAESERGEEPYYSHAAFRHKANKRLLPSV